MIGGPFPLTSLIPESSPGLSLQFIRGRRWGDPRACGKVLDQALAILQDSFDPIEDVLSGQDLLPIMVGAETYEEHDYSGIYSVVLSDDGRAVSAATVRFFGKKLAEIPLVATAEKARRKGYAGVLVGALEATASRCGVERLVLPAASEVEDMWCNNFGFSPMTDEDVGASVAEFRILVFPGSRMLAKVCSPTLQ